MESVRVPLRETSVTLAADVIRVVQERATAARIAAGISSRIFDDLLIDSIGRVALLLALEEKFDCELRTTDVLEASNVLDLIEIVARSIGSRHTCREVAPVATGP
jgi:acyl carrier protein